MGGEGGAGADGKHGHRSYETEGCIGHLGRDVLWKHARWREASSSLQIKQGPVYHTYASLATTHAKDYQKRSASGHTLEKWSL